MSNLVYIASGSYKSHYQGLPFDNIYLVDNHLQNCPSKQIHTLNMEALESVEYFEKERVSIDYLVILRESRGEGGETYFLCSDMFMGYFMKILPQKFVWISNGLDYYGFRQSKPERPAYSQYRKLNSLQGRNYVSFNLPYRMTELKDGDDGYISPFVFSSLNMDLTTHVFKMEYSPKISEHVVSEHLTIRLIQDSIWLHEDELDHLFISFQPGYQKIHNFFLSRPKVSYYKQMEFLKMLRDSVVNGYTHIGFTPHYWLQYDRNYQKMLEAFIKEFTGKMVIDFYYLNSWFNCRHILKAIKTISRQK